MKGLLSVFADGVNSPKLDAPLGIHARFIYMHAALFLRAPGRKRQGEEEEREEEEEEAYLQTRGQLHHRSRLEAAAQRVQSQVLSRRRSGGKIKNRLRPYKNTLNS